VGSKSTVAGGSDTSDTPRPMRADAQRNRGRILDAAEVVFAAEGIEVPVDTIAEKAGVGVGTLYRHFPTKEKLCEAILLERLASLAEDARSQADAADAGAAFFGFLNHMAALSASKRDLIAAVMGAGIEFEEAAAPVKQDLIAAVGVLLARAQSACVVRADVTADTVVSLVVGTCQAAVAHADSFPGDQLGNVLGIVCDGLRCHD
jgi:AcrR family transcriptional regulator